MTLTETGDSTGKFIGTIVVSTTDVAGVLLIAEGDTVTVAYDDASCEGIPQQKIDFAGVDCSAPIISLVDITDIDDDDVDIYFATDEMGTTIVEYGETESLGMVYEDTDLTQHHNIHIRDLEKKTDYYFRVRSTDKWGNEAMDDNGGELYHFETESGFCFFKAMAARDGRIEEMLPAIRSFRDDVLTGSPVGRLLTNAYYRYSREAVEILDENPQLRAEVREALLVLSRYNARLGGDRFGEAVKAMLVHEGERVRALTAGIQEEASPELKVLLRPLAE